MKNLNPVHTIILFLFLSNIGYSQVASMAPVMKNMVREIKMIENDYGIINKVQTDLIFEKSSKFVPIRLFAGKDYYIDVLGEADRITDLEISLYQKKDKDWKIVKTNDSNKSKAQITFTPTTTAWYELEVKPQKWKSGYTAGRYTLIAYYFY